MSSRECSAVLNKLHGINFPKWIDALRESNRYWMEYDDFSRGAQGYLLVAEAVEDEWCPIASKLVNGKLDPSFKPIKALRTSSARCCQDCDPDSSEFFPLGSETKTASGSPISA